MAAYFGKQHAHVLRDIDGLLKSAPELRLSNFGETVVERENPSGGQEYRSFETQEHFAVLRDIRNLVAKEPSLGLHNFVSFKINDLTVESTSHYEMDRDGFTLLAMGFTGAKAIRWKLRQKRK